jgi:hypothetical protein
MLPTTTCCGLAAVVANLFLVWHAVRSAIDGAAELDEILVSAFCTACCSGSIAFVQFSWLILGSMGPGGLDVSSFGEDKASDSVAQVKNAYGRRRDFQIGAGLIM